VGPAYSIISDYLLVVLVEELACLTILDYLLVALVGGLVIGDIRLEYKLVAILDIFS
jgi:hypothetical protein